MPDVEHEDFETESRIQAFKLEDGSNFKDSERLPARIVVKIIKSKKDDDQTNKRAFRGAIEERTKS